MDDAWCPVCDRLIPPSKHIVPPTSTTEDVSNPASDSNSIAKPVVANDAPTTSTQPPPPTQQQRPQPPVPRRAKSKNGAGQLKTSASGRKLAKLAALTTTTTAKHPPPPPQTQQQQQPPPVPETSSKAGESAAASGTFNANAGKSNSKARTILTQPASLYCSEACRLADEHNYYTSGSVGGVAGVYSSSVPMPGVGYGSPSSSYQSASFVAPPLSSTSARPNSNSRSRSRTRSTGAGVMDMDGKRGSFGAINASIANAAPYASASSTTTSQNPYYLASPLLSPTPSFTSHQHQRQHSHSHSRRPSSFSRQSNNSDEERESGDAHPSASSVYATTYDPDRANGDYFRSLQRGERQGYFTTPATVISRSPPLHSLDESSSAHSEGVVGGGGESWDHIHRRPGFNNNHMTSMSSSSSASVSHYSSRNRKTSLTSTTTKSQGGKGTSAPAYVPTNGYLTHFSGLDIGAYRDRGGADGSFPYPINYPYPYPGVMAYPERRGSGTGYGRSSNASTTSSSRRRSSTSPVLVGVGKVKTKGKTPADETTGLGLTKVPLFALEPHWPGPLSNTSDSESDDERSSREREERERRSSNERERTMRPESMTTAPSTESVKGLILSELKLQEQEEEKAAAEGAAGGRKGGRALKSGASSPTTATATPRRPVPTRRSRTSAGDEIVQSQPQSLQHPHAHQLHSKSSASLRAGSTSTSRTIRKSDQRRDESSSASGIPIGGMASTAPTLHNPLSSSLPFSSSPLSTHSMHAMDSSSRKNRTKARPEHQHGLLVHVALPSLSTSSLSSSHSSHLRSQSLGAPMLPPSVSNVRASAEIDTSALPHGQVRPTAPSRSSLDELLQLPIQDALPPRMDARSRILAMNVSRARAAVADFQQSQSSEIINGDRTVGGKANARNGHVRSPSLTPAQSYRSSNVPRLDSLFENDEHHDVHANNHESTPTGKTATTTTPKSNLPSMMMTAAAGGGGPLLPNTAVSTANNGPSALFRNVSTASLGGAPVPVGPGGVGVDLETYVPTYPMEMLPGNQGERRKR